MARRIYTVTHALWEGVVIAHRALLANKTRSILTTLGIIIGVVTVTLMMMIIQGLNKSFAQQISFIGSDKLYIQKYPWANDGAWWKFRNRPDVTMDEFEAVQAYSTRAEAVAAFSGTARTVSYRSNALSGVQIQGVTASGLYTTSALPEYGRYISQADERASRNVAVIGRDVQTEVFGALNPLGRDIFIAGKPFRVVGILEEQGNFFGQSIDNVVNIPITTLFELFGHNRYISIEVKAKEGVSLDELEGELRMIMRRTRNMKPLEEDNFAINRQEALQNMYKTMTAGVYGAGLVIGGISLLVGGIGIMNIMLVSVTERTWEIGMRKAVGARTSHILWQFLVESMMITVLGGTVGIGLALLGGLAVQQALPAVLPPWLAAAAVFFSAAVGLIFGIFPAAKAAKMDPIAALRAK